MTYPIQLPVSSGELLIVAEATRDFFDYYVSYTHCIFHMMLGVFAAVVFFSLAMSAGILFAGYVAATTILMPFVTIFRLYLLFNIIVLPINTPVRNKVETFGLRVFGILLFP